MELITAPGVVQEIGLDIDEPVHLTPERAEIFDEYRDVVIGILATIASRAGAEQHHPLEAVAIKLSERGAKALQDRIVNGRTQHRILFV
jgi:hypothetical protein